MAKANAPKLPLLFYSYSHEDTRFLKALSTHLTNLKRQSVISDWNDSEIVAGDEWRETIQEKLDAADIILLLVSASFVASDFCWGDEMTFALKKHEAGRARVIPVVIRPGDYEGARFKEIQMLPTGAKAITLWPNRDLAWLDVAKGIRKAVAELTKSVPGKPTARRPKIARTRPASVLTSPVPAGPTPRKSKVVRATSRELKVRNRRKSVERSSGQLNRTIYDAGNKETLPGKVARREGDTPTRDATVDEAYDSLGLTYTFFLDVYGRNSIDDKGMPLEVIVHYGRNFDNTFWTGKQIVIGDGDGRIFNSFTKAPDVLAKEYAMGVVQSQTDLEYWEQPGAIHQSFAVIFSALVKQFENQQTANQASWIMGEGVFARKVKGRGILSLAQPGTAYDDDALGKDLQPGHMRDYVKVKKNYDYGGIHINSGILNRAFYLTAITLGGYAWEKAGHIWYESLRDKQLKPKAQFTDLARITLSNAGRLYGRGSDEARAVGNSWEMVGIKVAKR